MRLFVAVAVIGVSLGRTETAGDEERILRDYDDFFSRDRNNTVIRTLLVWNKNLTPKDREVKFCAVTQDPFYFFRGTNHLYYRDMYILKEFDAGLRKYEQSTWIQGDLHNQNYGSFDSAQKKVAFNINDFDEAVVADFQYDIWRFVASTIITLRDKNLTKNQMENLVGSFMTGYLDQVALAASGLEHDTFTEEAVVPPLGKFLRKVTDKNSRKKMLDKWAPKGKNGKRAFNYKKSKGKLSPPTRQVLNLFTGDGFREYYESLTANTRAKYPSDLLIIKDVAERNLAGTGSLGAGRYYVLVEGPTLDQDDDEILDVKEQSRPAPYFYMGEEFMGNYTKDFGYNDAARHNIGLLSLLREVDPFLGYFRQPKMNDTYSVRSRSPWKKSLNFKHYDYDDLLLLVNQYGQMIGADHSKASNQPIVRVNNTSTTNFCPGKFAERMRDMLNLTASLPAKAQRSVEAREFLAIVNRVARFYADRVEKDYRIFQHFAVHVLNLKNCNIEAIWEEGQRHEAGKDDKHEEEEDNLEFASIPDRTYSATALVLAFFAGAAIAISLFAVSCRRPVDRDPNHYVLIA